MNFPKFITHYNRSQPFRSISGLPTFECNDVIGNLDETKTWGLDRFSDPDYLKNRIKAEEKMKHEFIAKQGTPTIENPIYFFLGRDSDFEKNKLNRGYAIQLDDINEGHISFTYGDSLIAYIEQYRNYSGKRYHHPCCSRLFTLSELKQLMKACDYPKGNLLKIEVQLWTIPNPAIVKELRIY